MAKAKKSWLDLINSPEDLKKIPKESLGELAVEIREKIISVVSKNGGHLASNLGAVELTIALHFVFDSPQDKIIWDVGHQSYTHKLLTGRKGEFDALRKYQGLSGFPNISESPHDVFNVGHASTSISSALGLVCARDRKKQNFNVTAVIGDGALTGGLAYEGLNNAGAQNKNILVVLNDNTMSISKNVGGISKYLTQLITDETYNKLKAEIWEMTGKLKKPERIRALVANLQGTIKGFLVPGVIFEKLGFRYFGPIDGHDLPLLIKTLEHLKTFQGPLFLHVLTKKGKGYEPAENDSPRFHGIGAFDKVTGNSNGPKGEKTYTDVFGKAIYKLAEKNEKIIGITAAMSLGTGLFDFASKFPDRFYDVGIAEQHGATFSAGLAALGLKPVFAVYSTFLQRAFDQVIHDIALQNLPVILAVDRAGLVGEDGPTHHGTFDINYLRGIPNFTIMAPKDGSELKDMLYTAVNYIDTPVAIRYPRSPIPDRIKNGWHKIEYGKWEVLKKGKDLLILATGSMVYPALEAADELEKQKIDVTLVNCRFIKPLDHKLLNSLLKKFDRVLTIEENTLSGGFGSAVLEYISANGFSQLSIKRMGIPDEFISHGKRNLLLRDLRLDKEGIVRTVSNLVNSSWGITKFLKD